MRFAIQYAIIRFACRCCYTYRCRCPPSQHIEKKRSGHRVSGLCAVCGRAGPCSSISPCNPNPAPRSRSLLLIMKPQRKTTLPLQPRTCTCTRGSPLKGLALCSIHTRQCYSAQRKAMFLGLAPLLCLMLCTNLFCCTCDNASRPTLPPDSR